MVKDQKKFAAQMMDMRTSSIDGSDFGSITYLGEERPQVWLSSKDKDFVQSLREQAIIKILENGVRLCLKLQTSHIASMYFEKWIDKKKQEDAQAAADSKELWIETTKAMTGRDLRSYLDLITLSCVLVAAKVNEQNQSQPTISDL